jgi:hypothetical protein
MQMKLSEFSRNALSVGVAAMLAGCGGSQPPIGAPGAIPQNGMQQSLNAPRSALEAQRNDGASWMAPEAKSQDLLYVAGGISNHGIYVFSYPRGKMIGMLSTGHPPLGECVDSRGDIFVAEAAVIMKYAHGGTKPIETLNDPGGSLETAQSCSVDPTSGNLAVTSWSDSAPGHVYVYPNASGMPIAYGGIPGPLSPFYCAYDDVGDLFAIGRRGAYQMGFDELRKGSSGFVQIGLGQRMGEVDPTGGVQWDGKYIVVAAKVPYVYQYKLRGRVGRRAGQTALNGESFLSAFWLQGNRIIVPNGGSVLIYNYPAGGSAIKTIPGFSSTDAAVVSLAPGAKSRSMYNAKEQSR